VTARCGELLAHVTMTGLQHDLRYAVRSLAKAPGFTAVAVATLGLGIGASTALFSIVDAVLLRQLSFPEPQRLVTVWMRLSPGHCCARISPAYLHDWRLGSGMVEDMAGWYDVRVNLTGWEEPLEVRADRVTSNFFDVLGTPALVGRTFTSGGDLRDVEPEVVLSHGFWRRRFGGDPAVVGRAVTLDGDSLTIVGVMPEGFAVRTLELAESRAEIWIPLSLAPGDTEGNLSGVARLAPGATLEKARAELAVISARIQQEHPSYSRERRAELLPLHDATVKGVRRPLLVLFGSVGLLLLIACVNVANLSLSRASTRRTELAIRQAIGATPGRLVRQLLAESLVLAGVGGALGVLLAFFGSGFLVTVLPAGLDLPRTSEIVVDLRVLAFALATTLLTATLFGLLPLIATPPSAPQSGLREAMRGASSGAAGGRLRGALVVSEVALALVLLAGAGLLGRTLWKLSRVDPGFRSEQVLTLRTTLPASRYESDDRIRGFGRELLARIERLPGVRAAGSVNYLPMSRYGEAEGFEIEGHPEMRPEDRRHSWTCVVGGAYFEAMGIPLVRGRLPSDADNEEKGPVFVIDETLARRFWPDGDPIGARLTWGGGLSGEVVGVVGSVRWMGMAAEPVGSTYFWFPQRPRREITIVARTEGDASAMASRVAAQVSEIDPNQPVGEVRTLRDHVADELARPRFIMVLLGSFSGTALLLAAIGLYGVIAFGVARRTREIGVRVALGAERRDVLRLVMKRGVRLSLAGITIGTAAALAAGRFVAALLYEVSPADPATLVGAAVFLGAVATLATWLPARRATRLDPVAALRCE
jgi:putative ABC transport system permease protein